MNQPREINIPTRRQQKKQCYNLCFSYMTFTELLYPPSPAKIWTANAWFCLDSCPAATWLWNNWCLAQYKSNNRISIASREQWTRDFCTQDNLGWIPSGKLTWQWKQNNFHSEICLQVIDVCLPRLCIGGQIVVVLCSLFLVVFPMSFLASKCWKAKRQNSRLLFYLESMSMSIDITTKVNMFPIYEHI